jgi:hypothetical protein
MNKKIFRYVDFLSESSMTLLLEAKMRYNVRFRELLGKIDSRIAKELIGLSWAESQKEIDVNTNYIEIIADKDDMVSFRPDDKVAEVGKDLKGKSAKTAVSGAHYDRMSQNILGDKYRTPANGQIGVIEREITKEEAGHGWEFVYNDSTLVVFMWRDTRGEGRCVFDRRSLDFSPEAVKPSEIGVGRLVRGLLSKAGVEFNDSEIEDFVYKYRAEIGKLQNVLERFRIVSGTDIRKAYHYESYEEQFGSLGNSCMRYDGCQDFFGIYVDNQETCSLVVLDSEKEEGKICGRALLWTDNEGRRIMDRIYVNRQQDEELFKQFARKNGFLHKASQNMEENPFVSPEGKTVQISTIIRVRGYFYKYPYMDTFKYYKDAGESSYLTNDSGNRYDYMLTDTGGGNGEECEMCGGEGSAECPECNGRGSFRCQNCDGGTIECDTCGGAHEMECPDCDGAGTNEDDRGCSGCSGTGIHTCEECGGKDIECGDCGGEGRIECDDCEGNGSVPCPECQ